jgi:hypothetical protein
MTEDQLDFYNPEKPCPDSIINCEKLRQQYTKEKEDLMRKGGCGGCMERSLKGKYAALVMALTKKT